MKPTALLNCPPAANRGVTLIEACTVLAIAAVLATHAAPGLRGLIDGRRLEGAASQLATDIQWVRTEAVARNAPLRLSVHAAGGGTCYVVHTGNADQCSCAATGPAQCSGDARQIKTVTVASTDRIVLATNVTSILFDPLHGTATPTGTLRFTGANGREIRHVVNLMGRVRSCSPRPAAAGYAVC